MARLCFLALYALSLAVPGAALAQDCFIISGLDYDGDGEDCDTDCNDDPYDNGAHEFNGQVWFADCDDDGYFDSTEYTACLLSDAWADLLADGGCTDLTLETDYSRWAHADPGSDADCDDQDASANPGEVEVCDGVDNDCDTDVDEDDAADASTWYADDDDDGYGDPGSSTSACDAPSGYVSDDTDCDDRDEDIHPGVDETCDGDDNDCDGDTDEPDATDATTWYADCDGDLYFGSTPTVACDEDLADDISSCSDGDPPVGGWDDAPTLTGDCDDGEAAANPGEDESCDDIDNDCDGDIDEADAVDVATWYADTDEDGFGDSGESIDACDAPSGYVGDDTDCDDTDRDVNPGQDEYCDLVDNDCDGDTDEDDAVDASTWYADSDGDDFGDPDASDVECYAPSGYVADGQDCDDGDASIHPGAQETCEPGTQVDSDCNDDVNTWFGEHPETGELGTWDAVDGELYPDVDEDGQGDASSDAMTRCEAGKGESDNNFDCDDGDASVYKGASEICDEVDQDCDGLVDEYESLDESAEKSGCLDLYRDQDEDGFGDEGDTKCLCFEADDLGFIAYYDGYAYVNNNADCDDLHAAIAPHECNDGRDNDMVDGADENDPDCELVPRGDPLRVDGFFLLPTSESGAPGYKAEILDGHDNDCDGYIPLVELDCDDDGSLPLVDVLDDSEFYGHEDLGLAPCSVGEPITVDCFDDAVNVECDAITGLWVFKYRAGTEDGWGGRYSGGYRNLESSTCERWGDCDDTCAARCPGATEVCDGLDNDCSDVDPTRLDSLSPRPGVPDALEGAAVAGTVSVAEVDKDGDGYVACDEDFGVADTQVQTVEATCEQVIDATMTSDCNDLCYPSSADGFEVCNGFLDFCEATPDLYEGSDGDVDDYVSCGAWVEESDLPEEIYVVVWADCVVDGNGDCLSPGEEPSGETGTSAVAATDSLVPLILPRANAFEAMEDGQGCDQVLYHELRAKLQVAGMSAEVLTREGATASDLLPLCESAAVGGECAVVALTLTAEADDVAVDDGIIESAIDRGFTDPSCGGFPEQYLTRTVWPQGRIAEARQAVVDWECLRLFGDFCAELDGTEPMTGAPAHPSMDGLLEDVDLWWMEVGRFAPRTAEGAMLSCWGDPRDGRSISRETGGDCDDGLKSVHRDVAEGPGDEVALMGLDEGSCDRCIDDIDNNCDGFVDCEDPSCAVCFVGQGGCHGGTCGGGGCATGSIPRELPAIFFVIGLLVALRAYRRCSRESPP